MPGMRSSAHYTAILMEQGYCVIDDLAHPDTIRALAADFEDEFAATGKSEQWTSSCTNTCARSKCSLK